MHFLRSLPIISILLLQVQYIIAQKKEALCIGDRLEIWSETLQENRVLNIYLPEGYHPDSSSTYPLIVLLDGGMDEDFLHVAGIAQFAHFPWVSGMPASIIVGIENTDRKRDFTSPSQNKLDQKELPSSGGSAAFIQFIKDEMLPLLHQTYPITDKSTIIGQSLGGLLATEILFKHPSIFDNYIIVSPSLWWDDERLLEANDLQFAPVSSVFIAVGKEGEIMERTAKELFQKIQGHATAPKKIKFLFLEECDHGNALHLSVYYAFEFLFSAKN